jgi:hypothetical protein
MVKTSVTTIHIAPEVSRVEVMAIAAEVHKNLVYAAKYRQDGWAEGVIGQLAIFLENGGRLESITVPTESISYLQDANKYPETAVMIAMNYQPSGLFSNNGKMLSNGQNVVVSYIKKYGGTKARKISSITESYIYFEGVTIPVPATDTHRIYCA